MKSFRQFAEKQQSDFLRTMLARLLPEESFAFKLRHSIGCLINSMLTYYRLTYPQSSPAEAAFLWLAGGNSLDIDWLAGVDGNFHDDLGARIPVAEIRLISASELMAAYSVWLIEVDTTCGPLTQIPTVGDFVDLGGGTELQRLNHKAECISLGYQALCYALRLSEGVSLNVEETEKVARFDFSKLGSKGGTASRARMRTLKEWAVDRYLAGTWKTASAAADALMEDVLAHGEKIGARLIRENARRTLSEWFRDAAKRQSDRATLINFGATEDLS